MTRPSDWRQRASALDLQHSFIVQAPAGSGKTELLIQRMLGLLTLVGNPEEVIAITFTRKAAAEMKHRIIGHLRAALQQLNHPGEDEEPEPHERISRDLALAVIRHDVEEDWNLLEQPGRLRIRTIDSLCGELARQLPVLSGLGGGQQIAEDATALYRMAATRTMAVIENQNDEIQSDIARVLDRYDNRYDSLVDLLTGMLASREQWIVHLLAIRKGDGFDRQGMEAALRFLVETQLEKAKLITPRELLSELPRFYHYQISNDANNATDLKDLLDACGGPDCQYLDLPTSSQALPQWQSMINSLLTSAGEMRKSVTKNHGFPAPSTAKTNQDTNRFAAFKTDFLELLDKYRDNQELLDIFNTILTLPSPSYEDEAWESLESLMRILIRSVQEWKLVMAESGESDYGEVAERAIQSLGSEFAPSELALRLDYRIQHLLVDEFQDTSFTQVKLLERLTAGWSDGDGRSLFLVGDPMQSIYGFRKAEVSLFISAWQGTLFDHIRLVPLRLSVNFRSTRPIVDWVNRSFPLVMPAASDPVMGAVSYTEAATKPGVADTGATAVNILPGRDDDKEARQVVEVIGRHDPGESIAILVQSRSHASAILKELDRLKADQARYRYQAIRFTPLADTTVIQDLVSLTLAVIQPADRIAWLATLRSPYIGLSLKDIDLLVAGNPENIILDAICKGALEGSDLHNDLSTDARQRLCRVGPVLSTATQRRGRLSARKLVESTWIRLGGPACVENPSEIDDAATYFDLIESLEYEGIPLDRDTLDLRLKELFAEPDANANGKLQVLTIHAAKGLQFDTVILPGLNRTTSGDDRKLVHWFELAGRDQIVISPMRNNADRKQVKSVSDLIKFISGVQNQRRRLEDGRLLYVASTRAKQNLYLFAAIKPNRNGDIKANANSLLGGLWPAIQAEQTPLIDQAARDMPEYEEPDNRASYFPQKYRRLARDWRLPAPPKSVQMTTSEPVDAQNYIEFNWAGEDARHTGNLVHRLLQLIATQGLESWEENDGMAKAVIWCSQQLASEGIQGEKAGAIIERVSRAIENSLDSTRGRWILASHEDAHCELAITAVLGAAKPEPGQITYPEQGYATNLVLDRTFIDKGIRWIIDYKISSHTGGDLDGFLANESERYRAQLRRYRNAVALEESLPIKTALYFPLLDRFLELE
jgi:ATP-dependent exoDNAse (exonuclease V) beta subunit